MACARNETVQPALVPLAANRAHVVKVQPVLQEDLDTVLTHIVGVQRPNILKEMLGLELGSIVVYMRQWLGGHIGAKKRSPDWNSRTALPPTRCPKQLSCAMFSVIVSYWCRLVMAKRFS